MSSAFCSDSYQCKNDRVRAVGNYPCFNEMFTKLTLLCLCFVCILYIRRIYFNIFPHVVFIAISAKWRLKSYRRGRSLNYVNFAFESTPMYIKTKGKFDNRNMKTLAADIDLTYIIKGIARDNVKFASKLMNWSTKTLTKARLSM